MIDEIRPLHSQLGQRVQWQWYANNRIVSGWPTIQTLGL